MTDKQDKRAKTNKNPENQTTCCGCSCGAGVRGLLALRQEETASCYLRAFAPRALGYSDPRKGQRHTPWLKASQAQKRLIRRISDVESAWKSHLGERLLCVRTGEQALAVAR